MPTNEEYLARLKANNENHIKQMEELGCHPTTIRVEESLLELLTATVIATSLSSEGDLMSEATTFLTKLEDAELLDTARFDSDD